MRVFRPQLGEERRSLERDRDSTVIRRDWDPIAYRRSSGDRNLLEPQGYYRTQKCGWV